MFCFGEQIIDYTSVPNQDISCQNCSISLYFFSNVYNFLARSIIKKLNHNHDFSFFLQKLFGHHARPNFRAVNSNFVNFLFESNAEGGLSNKNPS